MLKRKSDEIECGTSQGEKAVKLGPYQQKGEYEDEVVQRFDDDRELYASSAFLRLISPVFKAMLEHHFKEKETGVVKLKGKNYEDFLDFLLLCSSTDHKPVTGANVYNITPLSEEYQVHGATEACKYVLLTVACDFSHGDYLDRVKNYPRTYFNDLKILLRLLSVCARYSYEYIVHKAVNILAKFPCYMYLYINTTHSEQTSITECYNIYKTIPDSGKVALLEARLGKPFN